MPRYNIAIRVHVKAGSDLHPQECERALVIHLHERLRSTVLIGQSGKHQGQGAPMTDGNSDIEFEIIGVSAQPDIYTMIGTTRIR